MGLYPLQAEENTEAGSPTSWLSALITRISLNKGSTSVASHKRRVATAPFSKERV